MVVDIEQRRRFGAALVAVFVVSRLLYAVLGVRFTTSPLGGAIQLLPRDLLEHDLWRSLWNLHAQPPGFNAFIGLGLHVPGSDQVVYGCAYLAMGIALTLTMYACMLELAVPPAFAAVVTGLFVVSPTTVLYENWLLYTYPVALLLCVGLWCFARFVRTNRTVDASGAIAALAAVALIRSSYHLVFVIAAACFVLFAARTSDRRRVAAGLAIPVAVVAGLYVKNAFQFGEFTSSTWLGMNMAHMMYRDQPPEVKAAVERGDLSRHSLVTPFVGLDRYPDAELTNTGVPALDLVSDGGDPNYNNRAYIDISDQYVRDVTKFIRMHPRMYASRVARGYRTAFVSAADYRPLQRNRDEIAPLVGLQNRLLGQYRDLVPGIPSPTDPGARQIAWGVVLLYGAVLAGGAVAFVDVVRTRRPPSGRRLVIVFGAGILVYSLVTSNVIDLGDNNRFRFETDPMVCVLATALMAVAWARHRARRRERSRGRDREPSANLSEF